MTTRDGYRALALEHAVERERISWERPVFDERDADLIADFMIALDEHTGPRVGDFVRFADDVLRRVSYIWPESGVQTSDEGSFYLGKGYVSFSGSLYRCVPSATLTRTDEQRLGRIWTFHHNFPQAHHGVHTSVPFRIYRCSERAPD